MGTTVIQAVYGWQGGAKKGWSQEEPQQEEVGTSTSPHPSTLCTVLVLLTKADATV